MQTLARFLRVLAIGGIAMFAACGGSDAGTDPDPDPNPSVTAVGYLFVAAGGSLNAFTEAQTTSSSTAFPALTLQHNLGYTLGDIALDRGGNIWAVGVGSNTVVRFRATNTPGVVAPDLTISSSDLLRPWGVAFDRAGNLWVTNSAGGGSSYTSIARFNNPQSLTGNQTLSAALVIRPPTAAGPLREQYALVHGLAFDAAGNLWAGGPSTILRFNNPQNLSGAITPTPDAVIDRAGYGNQFGFSGMLAFDGSGGLWATGCQGLSPCVDFAIKFANPTALSGVSSPAPATRVTLGDGRQSNGMAFDTSGSLWIIYDGLGRAIARIANPGSLTGNVSASPATSLNNTALSGLSKVVFFPTPGGLPIY